MKVGGALLDLDESGRRLLPILNLPLSIHNEPPLSFI